MTASAIDRLNTARPAGRSLRRSPTPTPARRSACWHHWVCGMGISGCVSCPGAHCSLCGTPREKRHG